MAFNDQPWAWVNLRDEREENRRKFATIVAQVRPRVQAGDLAGAKALLDNATRPAVPPPPKPLTTGNPAFKAAWDARMKGVTPAKPEEDDDDGGFRAAVRRGVTDRIKSGASKAKDVGAKAFEVAQVPANVTLSAITDPFVELQDTGTGARPTFNTGTALRGLGRVGKDFATLGLAGEMQDEMRREDTLRDKYGTAKGGKLGRFTQAGDEFMATEDIPEGVKVGTAIAADPLNALGPGALAKIAGKTATATKAGRIAATLLENPAAASAGSAIGGGIAAQFGEDVPGFNKLPKGAQVLAGAVVGGGVAGAKTNTAAARARTAIEAQGGATAMLRGETGAARADMGVAGRAAVRTDPGWDWNGHEWEAVFPGRSDTAKGLIRQLDDGTWGAARPTQGRAVDVYATREDAIEGLVPAGSVEMRPKGRPYPKAGSIVSGLAVGEDIPNTGSIAATLENYKTIGVREVPMSAFSGAASSGYRAGDDVRRVRALADEIRQSGRIDPLIVVVDKDGPYILEGGHRFDALRDLKVKSFPALVVEDEGASYGRKALAGLNSETGASLPFLGVPQMANTPRGQAVASMLKKFEPTGLIAKAYGEIPILRKEGAGAMPTWITQAPDLYDDAGLLNFKNVLETTDGLPVSAKASNAVWGALGAASGGPKSRFTLRIDDPSVYHIKKLYEVNDAAIRDIADYMTETIATPALGDLARDEVGHALAAGKTWNLINEAGVPLPEKAGWRDIFEFPERYPEVMATLRPEQMDQIRALSLELTKIRAASVAMGIKVDPAVKTSEGGVYTPRGRPVDRTREKVATQYRGPKVEGRRAGSTKERPIRWEGVGIAKGKEYPDPVEAVRLTIVENLRQQNAMHAWNLLKEVPVNGGKLGDAQVSRAVADELGDIRPNIRTLSREKRVLSARKAIADRDARMLGGSITKASDRLQALYQRAGDVQADGAERLTVAREMVTTAKAALDDSLSAARELSKKIQSAAVTDAASRKGLTALLSEADDRAAKLDTLERMLASTTDPNGVSAQSLYQTSADDVAYMRQFQGDLYEQAAKAEAELMSLPVSDALTSAATAREELRNLRQMFGANMDESRRRAIDLAIAEGRETKAATNVRLALYSGQIRELAKDVEARGRRVRAAINRSDALGAELDDLVSKLDPLKARRTELLAQVKDVKRIARERSLLFDGEIGLEQGLGVPVPAAIANAFNKALRPAAGEPGVFTGVFDLVNNGMRTIGASLDASRQMTVGLLGMADNPGIAGKAVKSGLHAVKDPASMWRNLEQIQTAHPDMPRLYEAVGRDGLQIAGSEQAMAAGVRQAPNSFVGRISRLPGFKQADALYSAPSNIERAERYYKLLEEWKTAGKDYTSGSARARAAAVANLVSGRSRTGVLSPFVGNEAAGRVAFAGRFVQSQFETVFNAAFVGGVEGYEARKALLRLAAGGFAVSAGYNAFAEKTGQDFVPWDEFFEPGGPNMGRMRIAGRDVSIFGPWDSLAKGVVRAAQGDPEYFLRSKLAPVPSNIYSAISGPLGIGGEGKNAIGEPLGVTDVVPIPFGLRDIGEAALDTDPTDPAAWGSLAMLTGTALLGVKSAPTSPTERLSTIALRVYGEDSAAWQNGKATGKFYDLLPAAQAQIKRDHPDLFQEAVAKGSEERKANEAVKAAKLTDQRADDDLMLSGKLDRDKWNANVKTRGAELAGASAAIYRDDKANGRKGDALLDEYFQRIDDSKVNGMPDFDQVYAWVDTLPTVDQQKIEDNTGLNATPLRRLYKQIANEYYAIPRYSGMTADEANSASYLRSVARDRLSGRHDPSASQVIRLARELAPELGMSERDVANVAKLERGQARTLRQREQWARAHPESALILGNGPLSPAEISVVQEALSR